MKAALLLLLLVFGLSTVASEEKELGGRFRRQGDDYIGDDDYFGDGDYEDYGDDLFEAPPNPFPLEGERAEGPLPSEVILKISARYDLSLLYHFRGSHTAAKQWVQRVVELAKPRLKHPTLSIRVQLQLVGEVSHVPQFIHAGGVSMIQMKALLEAERTRHLVAFFANGLHHRDRTHGSAYRGTACRIDGAALTISELSKRRNNQLRSALTLAHELGHAIGMRHDHAKEHGGWRNPCNHRGLMSYGRKKDVWTTCSNSDFKEWYDTTGWQCLLPPAGPWVAPSPHATNPSDGLTPLAADLSSNSCQCNGKFLAEVYGECTSSSPSGCGLWCYVDGGSDSECPDYVPSTEHSGGWSCHACRHTNRAATQAATTWEALAPAPAPSQAQALASARPRPRPQPQSKPPPSGNPSCKYVCQPNGDCQVSWVGPARPGHYWGFCPAHGGACYGAPSECRECSRQCV